MWYNVLISSTLEITVRIYPGSSLTGYILTVISRWPRREAPLAAGNEECGAFRVKGCVQKMTGGASRVKGCVQKMTGEHSK